MLVLNFSHPLTDQQLAALRERVSEPIEAVKSMACQFDHDQPFAGFRPYQFSTRQLARLLQLRSELLDARLGLGRWVQDLGVA